MGFFSDVGGFISDPFGTGAIGEATGQTVRGQREALEEQRRQFDLTRGDLLPFLQAATGEGGALGLLQTGLEQAPLPPELQQFQFDPRAALENPALQFQREMGQQQLDRLAGRSRNLGSGQRLIGGQQFGQGLASQFLGEEFGRQQSLSQIENQRRLAEFGLSSDRFNQRLNRLAGLVDVGRGTGTALGQLGGQSASNISNLLAGIGATQGAGTLGQSGAIQQGIGTIGGLAAFGAGGGFGSGIQGLFGAGGGAGVPGLPSSNVNIGFAPTGLF